MTKAASFVLSIKDATYLPIDLSDELQELKTACLYYVPMPFSDCTQIVIQ